MRTALPLRFTLMMCLFGCGVSDPEGSNPGACSDGGDNDGDGLFDCDDSDCADSSDCATTTTTSTTATTTTTSTTTTTTTTSNTWGPTTEALFETFIYVDQQGVDATGTYVGFTPGSSWANTTWLTQSPDPVRQEEMNFEGTVEDYEAQTPVANATLQLWRNDQPGGGPSIMFPANSSGQVSGSLPTCQPTAHQTETDPSADETMPTLAMHRVFPAVPVPPILGLSFPSVSRVTYLLIPTILGVTIQADQALVFGTGFDVARDPSTNNAVDTGKIAGAQVIVMDANGNILPDVVVHYFTEGFPDRDQDWTSADGQWVAINVPPGDIRVELWGVVGGTLGILGATELSVESGVTLADIYAGYGDGVKFPDACL